MQALAAKTRTENEKSAHASARGAHSPEDSFFNSASSYFPPAIYRKASCACGGGCPACQAKSNLNISQPNDPAEIEADQIADQVMRMPVRDSKPLTAGANAGGKIHRKCDACEDEEEANEPVMRKEAFASSAPTPPSDTPPSIRNVINSGGSPLDKQTRSFFEPRFGTDLSHVRIHTDSTAGQSARSINAKAYTLGSNIVFGSGEYKPETESGKHLLAHELAHVGQSANGSSKVNRSTIYRQPGDDEGESEAKMTRAEEIELSKTSPGLIGGEQEPLALSLYNFGIDVDKPKKEHLAALTELGLFLKTYASVTVVVRSIGFADSTGADKHNMGLSKRRANSVKAALDPLITQKISISAFGETNPAAANDTVEGRTRNRRVDLRFYGETPPPKKDDPPPKKDDPPPKKDDPPKKDEPKDDDTTFCERHPILCGLGGLPFFAPLICLIAPELCLTIGCALLPELCIPPVPWPPDIPPDDPDKPKDRDPKEPWVIFSTVRAPNTPPGEADRIGLRDTVHVTATVINPPSDGSQITIFVSSRTLGAGEATVNGLQEVNIANTTVLDVLGTKMTPVTYPLRPNIQLGASWSRHLVGHSNKFGVTSIAENWSVIDAGSYKGRYGYASKADMEWVSDSGSYGHLGECRYVERVAVVKGSETGGMTGMGPGKTNDPDDINTCDLHPAFDEHGTLFENTRVAGHQLLKQLFTIRDMRSAVGPPWVSSTNSGFEIERTFERDPAKPKCWHLVVQKRGAAVADVNGWDSGAGSGSYTHEFRDINCDEPPKKDDPPPKKDDPPPKKDDPPPKQDDPQPAEPCCDRMMLALLVDQCIEQAKQDAIACTAATLEPPYDPISNAKKLAEYWLCLDQLKADLKKCDRKAKQDSNCPDGHALPDCNYSYASNGRAYAERSVDSFIERLRTQPLKPGEEDKEIV